jgi:hypothetical protein
VSGFATGNTLEFIPNRPYLRSGGVTGAKQTQNPGLNYLGAFAPYDPR